MTDDYSFEEFWNSLDPNDKDPNEEGFYTVEYGYLTKPEMEDIFDHVITYLRSKK